MVAALVLALLVIVGLLLMLYNIIKESGRERENLYKLIKANNLTEYQFVSEPAPSNKPQNWMQENIERARRSDGLDEE